MAKDEIKDLERRCLFWIIQVGPRCSHMCFYKKEAEAVLTQTHREAGSVKIEQTDVATAKE